MDGEGARQAVAASLADVRRLISRLCPEYAAVWSEGSAPDEVREFEIECGTPFPPALREYLEQSGGDAECRGGREFWFGFELMTLPEIREQWRQDRDAESVHGAHSWGTTSAMPTQVRDLDVCARWIPIATDQERCVLAVDLFPGPAGRLGQVIACGIGLDERYVIAESLSALLQFVRFGLWTGRIALGLDRGFEDVEIDELIDLTEAELAEVVERPLRLRASLTPMTSSLIAALPDLLDDGELPLRDPS